MKTLYESILDDEKVLISNVRKDVIAISIYKKLINQGTLEQSELSWMNDNVSVLEVNRQQLKNLLSKLHKKYYNISLNWLDVSKIADMSELFKDSKFNGDISKWDVSKVVTMNEMFAGAKEFNCDISEWDVSNVEYMKGMFKGATEFNQDISGWNVYNVVDMSEMFMDTFKFNQDISNWKVSNVMSKTWVFLNSGCKLKNRPKFKA